MSVLLWPMRPSVMVKLMVKPVRDECFSVANEIKCCDEASQI